MQKVSITRLEQFAETQTKPQPFFTAKEFNMIMLAVRNESRKHQCQTPGETPRQRHQRIANRIALDSAIIKLRTLTREQPCQ